MKVEAIKDGGGNIVISEKSFEMLLACLDNQKFVGEDKLSQHRFAPTNGDTQKVIDEYNRECRKILHQSYVLETKENSYFLTKKYEYQDEITNWTGKDVGLVYELFKDTIIKHEDRYLLPLDGSEEIKKGTNPIGKNKDGWLVSESITPWLIERPLAYDHSYLTISEDGIKNRPWKEDEIIKIQNLFNGLKN